MTLQRIHKRKRPMPPETKALLTRREAATYLAVQPTTLRDWYAAGRGPAAIKLGPLRTSRVRYAREQLDAWRADPSAYTEPARPKGIPRFEPPSRGRKHRGQT